MKSHFTDKKLRLSEVVDSRLVEAGDESQDQSTMRSGMEIFISSGLLQDQAVPRLSLWLLKWHTQVTSPLLSTTSVQLWLMDLVPAAPSLFWIERRAGLGAPLTLPTPHGRCDLKPLLAHVGGDQVPWHPPELPCSLGLFLSVKYICIT